MRTSRRFSLAAVALLLAASPAALAGQASDALYARFTALSGFELRGFSFDTGLSVTAASQWHIPIMAVAPLGRKISVDLSTNVASSTLETVGGSETVSGLTDTQLRLLYTIGRDRLVSSLSLNLPTGKHSVSTSQFLVGGAIGGNYLAFPVSSFGTAFGATGGLAYATTAGTWNVGLSGSLRYLGSYEPFSDQSLTYKPGVEFRVRGGVDRLVGQSSRVLVGLTASTFSTDQYTGSGSFVTSGSYAPGTRFIGEFAFVRVMGRSTITFAAWDFYRLAGDTNGTQNPATKENVLNAELRLARSLSPRLMVEPLLAFRQYSPADYRGGRLYSAAVTARMSLNDQFSAHVGGRFDTGWAYVAGRGRADLTGYGFTLFLRYQR